DGGPKLAAMLLALVGAYGYFYSLMVVERDNRLAYSGMFSLLWAEAMLIDLVGVLLTPTWIMAILAATALVALAAVRWMQYLPDERGRRPLLTTTSGVALGCTLLAIAVGLFE